MTRISEDGQGSRKGANDDYEQAGILPNLQIKSPQALGGKYNMKQGFSTNESFMSAAPKSVGSSRNTKKHFLSQPRHNRAHSNANANRASMYK